MKKRIVTPSTLRTLTLIACASLASCGEKARTDLNTSPTHTPGVANVSTAAGTGQPDSEAERPPTQPTLTESRTALERVYGKAVSIDASRPVSFVVGDFNADGSEDIAFVVLPAAGMLGDINSELANWIIIDPKKVQTFDPDKAVQTLRPQTGPVKIEPRDTLLAVLHGHGRGGWRSPEATQSYLLKNAAGDDLRVVPAKDFPPALKVRGERLNKRAHIISQKLAGVSGFLYWSSGKYIWREQ